MADKSKDILASITGAIKGYGKSMGERTKLQSQMAANQMELSQNALVKMMQKQAQNKQVQSAFQGGAGEMGYTMGYSPGGGRTLIAPSQSIYKRKIYEGIKAKQSRGGQLDERDQSILDQYEGVGKKDALENLSPMTQKVIKAIESLEDLQDLETDAEEYKAAGVDVDAVFGYLQANRETFKKEKPGLWQVLKEWWGE